MSINRTEAMNYIFNKLEQYVCTNVDRELSNINRYIKIDASDIKFLNKAKLECRTEVLSNYNVSLVDYDNKKYLFVLGDSLATNNLIIDDILINEEITAGYFILATFLLELGVSKSANAEEIYNDVLWQQEAEGYAGHDYVDIAKFYENITVFRIEADSNLLLDNIYNILCYYLILSRENIRVNMSEETIEAIELLVLSNNKSIPYHNISQALLSSHWPHVFLDTYRCIEHTFHIISLKEFYESLDSTKSLLEISSNIESIIGWKPKEEDAIIAIFKMLPADIVEIYEEVKSNDLENREMQLPKWYYKIRNAIAHFRPVHQPIKFTDDQWNLLIEANICVITSLYDEFKDYFYNKQ